MTNIKGYLPGFLILAVCLTITFVAKHYYNPAPVQVFDYTKKESSNGCS
ncbi:hypothetical protein EVB32_154 [Rhizobium phage RHph_TM39]|uniref:Uncharacterized protein n=2 Tax=Cuauhnahuacvirus TaxID=3044696 RepID=A0A7S5R7V3_9CAUD|nr:hypothetical protein PQC16_gp154 [Rhizobium phage RHph_TM30]YP_010671301.1 hypothetical protein PQC17_gp152 [Rhizobium phage RHph_Y65]QIG71623.1 hypothetical protein EVB94_152 [Rhizobium phage RHph_TM40]QIG71987.1 hypothetical protein EVB95_153 [Rhizobium phage RHph_TM2_3B]QIG72350.1 hypothetical protein EVB96_154 [Rhizobium phage RHph_TM3_3_6]QIG77142.1 hypothetical protein EVB32_154 [Rhizobium phage RHph_TM39]QIG77738.1 hypothetical protein EVB64_151 [Rhizobium phage RHph_TM61]